MAEQQPSHEAVLEQLRQKHGYIAYCVTPADPSKPAEVQNKLLAFRTPSQEEYEDWQEGMKKGRMGPVFRTLCLRTRVLPEQEEQLVKVFEAWPGLPARLADEITDLGGADIEVNVKKG